MKRYPAILLALVMVLTMTACGGQDTSVADTPEITFPPVTETYGDAVHIALSDAGITADGTAVTADPAAEVYTANDIIYYEADRDFTYGEGTAADAHTAEEAAGHTVLHITAPGTYLLTGSLSAGQIAVDLGDEAADDPTAVVTLVLGGADITCTVAPAVIFYSVYECGSTDTETATYAVDTNAAGANVIIADGTVNNISGSYVARIYKPESVELTDDGTAVADAKKLHKYDGAFYSKMSMNVCGGEYDMGVLNITAENEGLDTELHLTINGGTINITAGNDGINTNEDEVSVTTINGGTVNILCDGGTGEGDGIDSNGWLVINGGTVRAQACATGGDAGIDSDMGIYLNGGTVEATGNMLDAIAGGTANYGVFQFSGIVGGETLTLKNAQGEVVHELTPDNGFSYLIVSSEGLTEGEYTLWAGDTQLAHGGSGGMMGMPGMGGDRGMERPEGTEIPEGFDPNNTRQPEGMERPEGMELPEDFDPNAMEIPEGMERPDDGSVPQMGGGRQPNMGGGLTGEQSEVFTIARGGNMFSGVTPLEK